MPAVHSVNRKMLLVKLYRLNRTETVIKVIKIIHIWYEISKIVRYFTVIDSCSFGPLVNWLEATCCIAIDLWIMAITSSAREHRAMPMNKTAKDGTLRIEVQRSWRMFHSSIEMLIQMPTPMPLLSYHSHSGGYSATIALVEKLDSNEKVEAERVRRVAATAVGRYTSHAMEPM